MNQSKYSVGLLRLNYLKCLRHYYRLRKSKIAAIIFMDLPDLGLLKLNGIAIIIRINVDIGRESRHRNSA